MTDQYPIHLPPFVKGIHLITHILEQQMKPLPETGLLNLFIPHTSAALAICENFDPDVRHDIQLLFDRLAPENLPAYRHTSEGSDDMPAHFKALVTGCSLSIPITHRRMNLGTWQGICLCEFREEGGRRKILVTVID